MRKMGDKYELFMCKNLRHICFLKYQNLCRYTILTCYTSHMHHSDFQFPCKYSSRTVYTPFLLSNEPQRFLSLGHSNSHSGLKMDTKSPIGSCFSSLIFGAAKDYSKCVMI